MIILYIIGSLIALLVILFLIFRFKYLDNYSTSIEFDQKIKIPHGKSLSKEDLEKIVRELNTHRRGMRAVRTSREDEIEQVEDEIEQAVKKLKEGHLNFKCPDEMKLGKKENVMVEIFKDKKLLESVVDKTSLSDLKVGNTMAVKLLGDDFEITSKNSESQVILNDMKTTWIWDVKPLRHGLKNLELVVTVKLKIENKDELYDYSILTKNITVKVSRAYIAGQFWKKNWQWVISTIVGSGVVIVILKALGVLPK